ncbi:Sodium/hydrogen exchanger family-domain-containing protein [Naematelia encephala]|uniref:Sodium/hydrogen exchanger family-domain-containing protein n=1 Tax=Naematelia encephala TaxID=71784 RepID=A0A1Y2APT8_9TREE|nr:Sodium/hydrogen exchanger family-domain-containing protein [Naematelia encephala]
MKQPKVIAEVIGGIILGPTVMGRIPNFSFRIFPTQSVSYLNLVANIGLILFLFLVGLEVDVGIMKRNGRNAALISLAGMVLPFGLGAAIAVPVYNNFVNSEKVTFGHFLLFVGVAMAITAFPVLCRILTATKLLDTTVGVVVLAAGVGNDVVGWVLLALTLALVNANSGVTAVYVLLCAVGWGIILLWPIRRVFVWLCRRSGSLHHGGPTPGIMVLTLLIVFSSAFVTGIIGVHPIFGAFLAGLIIPHEGGFAIALVEKIDDLVAMLFLPIYFVLSGLSTNLGLLNTGKIWGYVIALCAIAWVGKFGGCAGMAKALGYNLRESGAIGMLMSCKGLVELIVLNVGLSAGIIDQRLFSMFVVEALVLTFITTPFTLLIYPERVRDRGSKLTRKDVKDAEKGTAGDIGLVQATGGKEQVTKFLVVLQKIEHLAAVMFLTQMLEPPSTPLSSRSTALHKSGKHLDADISDESIKSTPKHGAVTLPTLESHDPTSSGSIRVDALKLIELTGRTFSVMQSAEKDQLLVTDDALQLYRQFGRLRGLDVDPHIAIVGQDSFPAAVAEHAEELGSEMIIVPWTVPPVGSSGSLIDPSPSSISERDGLTRTTSALDQAPFEGIFGSETQGSPMYTHFVRRVFTESPSDVALFVDRGFGSSASFSPGSGQHVFMPFFGGMDDRLALRFVVQLCHHRNVTATIIRIQRPEDSDDGVSTTTEGVGKGNVGMSESMQLHQRALQSNQLTIGGTQSPYHETANALASETADNLAWQFYTSTVSPAHSEPLASTLSRVTFWSFRSTSPLSEAYLQAETAIANAPGRQWRPMLIVTGRGRRGAALHHDEELARLLAEKGSNPSIGAELRKTVGDAATALILGGGASATASFLVLEAGKR